MEILTAIPAKSKRKVRRQPVGRVRRSATGRIEAARSLSWYTIKAADYTAYVDRATGKVTYKDNS